MLTQQVKADPTDQQPTTLADNSNNTIANTQGQSVGEQTINNALTQSTNTTAPKNGSTSDPVETPAPSLQKPVSSSIPVATPTNISNTDTQDVNVKFTDQNGNDVVDSNNNPYTFSGTYNDGDTIKSTDLSDNISKNLNGGYTLDPAQGDITVEKGADYVAKVVAKTYKDVSVSIYDPSGEYNSYLHRNNVTVGKKSNVLVYSQGENGSTFPISGVSIEGYGLTHLSYNKMDKTPVTHYDKIPNTNSDGTITLTYDMLPEFAETYRDYTFHEINAIYDTPLNQSITLQHIDDQGNKIPGSTDTIINTYKTGDIIADPSTLAPIEKFDGYKYFRTTQNYKVSTDNTIQLIYTNDDVDYLTVNYKDKDTGKTIYTDYARINDGTSATIQDISAIDGYSNYKMSDSNNVNTYAITSDNKNLPVNIDIQQRGPLNVSLIQHTNSNINLTSRLITDYGKKTNFDTLKYLDDHLESVSIVTGSINGQPNPSAKVYSDDPAKDLSLYTIPYLLNTSFGIPVVATSSLSDSNLTLNIIYKPNVVNDNKPITVSYQTPDGTKVGPITLTNTSTDSVDAGTLITSSLPAGYEFVDPDNLYTISSVDGSSIELVSQVKKVGGSNNTGNSNNDSGSSDHDTGEITGIEENISTHPNLTTTNVYDDDGNLTDESVNSNTDFSTDEKLQLDGKTYYRIAQNKWLNADDIYIYYTDSTYVRTYIDSAKELVNSQDKTVSDRELAAGSNWHSDRYTYLNDQKYYRVATNELVSAKDAFEYQPIYQVVQPNNNARLFDDRGNFVKFAPKVSLRTDKVATINGFKMYRVATNEWLPVTDVK